MSILRITEHADGPRVTVVVKPRSSLSKIVNVRDGNLVIALAAPPVDGEANLELLRFLSSLLRLPKSTVLLQSGAKSRTKVVQFLGITASQLNALLYPALAPLDPN